MNNKKNITSASEILRNSTPNIDMSSFISASEILRNSTPNINMSSFISASEILKNIRIELDKNNLDVFEYNKSFEISYIDLDEELKKTIEGNEQLVLNQIKEVKTKGKLTNYEISDLANALYFILYEYRKLIWLIIFIYIIYKLDVSTVYSALTSARDAFIVSMNNWFFIESVIDKMR